ARHRKLARAAAAQGDLPRQARHEASACAAETLTTFDLHMASPACAEARRLARITGLLDVQLTLDGLPAELSLKFFNFPAAETMLAQIIARGATLDAASPEARPVRRARI